MSNVSDMVFMASDVQLEAIDLPDLPAVYGWYRNLQFNMASKEQAVDTISADIAANISFPLIDGEHGVYNIKVSSSSTNLPEAKRKLVESIAATKTLGGSVRKLSSKLSTMQLPLYVGSTEHLKHRTLAHINGSSDFGKKLKIAGVPLNRLLIRAIIVEGFPVKAEELFEFWLSVVGSPPYVRRRG